MPAQTAESALKEMRSELNSFVRFLQNKKLVDDAGSTYGIGDSLDASKSSKGVLKWGYKSGKLALRLATGSVICPAQTKSLACTMEIAVEGEIRSPQNKGEELVWSITSTAMNLEFSADSSTVGAGWSQYWHLDTHIDPPGTSPPDEAHPMFHLHFGGGRMAARRLAKAGCWGQMLEMHGPRIAHPPLDLILALDFILANATGPRWKKEFCKAKEYSTAVGNSQRRFWKPYKETLVAFYGCKQREQETHPARLFWPALVAQGL